MGVCGRHAVLASRWWPAGAVVAGLAAAAGAATAVAAVLVARFVVMPPRSRRDTTAVVSMDAAAGTITLELTAESLVPGRYGFWFSGGSGHLKIGDVVGRTESTVTRRLLGVDHGDLDGIRSGRFSGWFFLHPDELGLTVEDVLIDTAVGPAPAWLVPADPASDRWVISVHGRGVTRQETLRGIPAVYGAGFHSLLVSWRNDGDAPSSSDGRYALGETEWRDVEAGIRFALDRGAATIVLMGWSMGGAAVLQAIDRSGLRHEVQALILESPVVDWGPTLDFQAKQMKIPRLVRRTALVILASGLLSRVTGQHERIDFDRLDFVTRAGELALPILLLHSADDGYVPPTASRLLAAARPDLVRYREWTVAKHARLWNLDAERFERDIRSFLLELDENTWSSAGGNAGTSEG